MINQVELVSRLLVAAALGSAIGFERERLSWAAGLRTHMLVCVGSCLLMIVSAFGFTDVLGTSNVVLDPSRIAAQVVSGIGFLGAGAILMRGEIIRGLTTAASLWSVAAIGLAIGGGLYTLAIAATLIILIILAGIKPLEKRYFASRQRRELRLSVDRGAMTLQALHLTLGPSSARVKQFVMQQSEIDPDADEVAITLARVSDAEFEAVRVRLEKMAGVRKVSDG
jgi:putative Mg2+ transporter-C (MgtC) family protein